MKFLQSFLGCLAAIFIAIAGALWFHDSTIKTINESAARYRAEHKPTPPAASTPDPAASTEPVRIYGHVSNVHETGVVVLGEQSPPQGERPCITGELYLENLPNHDKLAERDLIDVTAIRDGGHRFRNQYYEMRTLRKFSYRSK